MYQVRAARREQGAEDGHCYFGHMNVFSPRSTERAGEIQHLERIQHLEQIQRIERI